MKKKQCCRFALLAALLFLLSACGQPQKDPGDVPRDFASVDMETAEISPEVLAVHLLAETAFDDALIQIDPAIAGRLYGIEGLYDSLAAYGSTGATAEAILVVACPDAETAAEAAGSIERYRAEMTDIYADYNQKESGKLRRAVLDCDGRYVVFCAAPDPDAARAAYHAFVAESIPS